MLRILLTLLLLFTLPLTAEEAVAPLPAMDRGAHRLTELRALATDGEQLDLMTAQGNAFALYLPDSSGKRLGGVILLHDDHKHLLDPPLQALRRGLSEHGWDTLTLQLPARGPSEERVDWLDRSQDHIGAALAYMEGRQSGAIVLIGQGSGALLAIDWLFSTTRDKVLGLVTLSLDGSANPIARLDAPRQLALVNVPVLDIQAQYDRAEVRLSAARRAREAQRPPRDNDDDRLRYRDIARDYTPGKGDQVHYRQLQIPSTDHTYYPNQELLLRAVRGWLQRHARLQ